MLASSFVTAAWSLATRFSIIQGGSMNELLQAPPQEKNPLDLELTRQGAIYSALNVQSNFLDTSRWTTARRFPHSAPALRCADTASTGTSWRSLGGTISRKSRCPWEVSHSGSRQGAEDKEPDDSSPKLSLKCIWYRRSRIAWGSSRAQKWLLWTFGTPLHVEHTSSVHRMLSTWS
jgi:hypothetical protein